MRKLPFFTPVVPRRIVGRIEGANKMEAIYLKADAQQMLKYFHPCETVESAETSKGLDLIHLGQSVQRFEEPRALLRDISDKSEIRGLFVSIDTQS